MKKERLKKLEEINKKMGDDPRVPKTPFLPYDNINKVGDGRTRSRGLMYQENLELQKYQK